MTREEILSIEEYCAAHKVSHRKRLEELNIPFWQFYKAKKKYRKDDEQDSSFGEFIQLSSGKFVPQVMPPARTPGKSGKASKLVEEKNASCLTCTGMAIASRVYSLFSCCKAHNIDVREWLEDTLKRIPTEKDIDRLLPCNWKVLPANSR